MVRDPLPRRVRIDPELAAVPIPAPILNDLCRHAREDFPEECCGLILGDASERFREVRACRNEMTQQHQRDPVGYPLTSRQAYFMSPVDYQAIHESCAGRGLRVTAVYHSHVGTGAYLSELDLAYAGSAYFPFPDADQIVVALHDRGAPPEIGLFERRGGARFVGRAVSWARP
jgi:proteasome lid subunit RPN8/RPN11